jgi:hypothetical protein
MHESFAFVRNFPYFVSTWLERAIIEAYLHWYVIIEQLLIQISIRGLVTLEQDISWLFHCTPTTIMPGLKI